MHIRILRHASFFNPVASATVKQCTSMPSLECLNHRAVRRGCQCQLLDKDMQSGCLRMSEIKVLPTFSIELSKRLNKILEWNGNSYTIHMYININSFIYWKYIFSAPAGNFTNLYFIRVKVLNPYYVLYLLRYNTLLSHFIYTKLLLKLYDDTYVFYTVIYSSSVLLSSAQLHFTSISQFVLVVFLFSIVSLLI